MLEIREQPNRKGGKHLRAALAQGGASTYASLTQNTTASTSSRRSSCWNRSPTPASSSSQRSSAQACRSTFPPSSHDYYYLYVHLSEHIQSPSLPTFNSIRSAAPQRPESFPKAAASTKRAGAALRRVPSLWFSLPSCGWRTLCCLTASFSALPPLVAAVPQSWPACCPPAALSKPEFD